MTTEERRDYIVTLTVTLGVRVENWDDRDAAVDRAVELLDEELDGTSFYLNGTPRLENVVAD